MLAYSGKGQFVTESINCNALLEEMAHLLRVSISKKAILDSNFHENLPAFAGDASQIVQIAMYPIVNASEATGAKSVVITISTGTRWCDQLYLKNVNDTVRANLDEDLSGGVYTYFEVSDTGCGMSSETIDNIFDPFYTTKFTGRGLGISAVLGIVWGHKGVIKIKSELGMGTTFKVLFPALDLAVDRLTTRKKTTEDQLGWRGTGTILPVDDDDAVTEVAKQILESIGFEVFTAPDVRAALQVFEENIATIICVLLDLTMPHMDGEETFITLKSIHPDVKVILCSGYCEQDATDRFFGKGLAGFLQKPFTLKGLKKIMLKVVGA